jgi:hypothetical protein
MTTLGHLKSYTKGLIKSRLAQHQALKVLEPRTVRLAKRLELSEKETLAIAYVVISYGSALTINGCFDFAFMLKVPTSSSSSSCSSSCSCSSPSFDLSSYTCKTHVLSLSSVVRCPSSKLFTLSLLLVYMSKKAFSVPTKTILSLVTHLVFLIPLSVSW